ncbi:PRA1 family protein F3-like [Typha angustifolia]|uniref:PRA1 family protein F3-like n=1 Tax=Typha angustifolia TaxID=59011 RepID=UPI003C30E531
MWNPTTSSPAGYGAIYPNQPPVPPPPRSSYPAASRFADLVSRVKGHLETLMAARRPSSELFDPAAFSLPDTTSDAATRLRRNFAYFRANYAIAVLLVLLLCLLSQPSTFLAIAALFAAWFFLYLSREGPLILFNRVVDDGAVLSVLSAATVVVVFLTEVGWTLIGSVTLGVGLVGLHAVFRSTEDLFLGEMDAVNAAVDGEEDFDGVE